MLRKINKETGEIGDLIAGGTLYADAPIGTILPYGGTTLPTGYLFCIGQAVSRTTYSELFAIIGTSFGAGDGSTTYNLPDMRESVPVGIDKNDTQTIANHDVYELGEFKDDQVQDIGKMQAGATNDYSVVAGGIAGYVASNSALRTGETTHGKQLGVNYIIKAKDVGVPADFLAKVDEAMVEKNSYSTEETLTGGKWIDGKPIYRKVFTFTDVSTNIDLSELNISDIIMINSSLRQTNGDITMFPYAPNEEGEVYSSYIKTGYYKTSTKEWIWQFGNTATTNFTSGILIIEYTKTTD